MAVDFNHTIVWAKDSKASAAFLAEILGLPAPRRWGPFLVVATDNGVNVDFMDAEGEIAPQHYAFVVGEREFDEIFGRVRERSLPYWADPAQRQTGEIITTAGAAFISRTRTGTFWRSSPVLTEAAAGIRDGAPGTAWCYRRRPMVSKYSRFTCSPAGTA
jgi:hypothetical protein